MIGAVVLAAGRSTRMGAQKLLLPVGGKPIITQIVDELLMNPRDRRETSEQMVGAAEEFPLGGGEGNESRISRYRTASPVFAALLEQIVVVVGRDAELIRQALSNRPVLFVKNLDPEGDMLSSVRCGLRALPNSCEAFLVALGDQPAVTHKLVAELVRAFQQSGRSIIVPAHEGRRGHPLLLAARWRNEMLTRYNSVGLRGLLDSHPEAVFEMAVSTASVLEDLDTPEDYQRHLESTTASEARQGS